VERSAVHSISSDVEESHNPTLCHLDRSAA
jgi:hypothetical protein